METQRITQSLGPFEPGQQGQQLVAGVTLVNRYLIQDVVGVGGMGAVYRARDLHFPKLVKLVAVKEMVNQARDPIVRKTIVQNFEREANILATLNHPSIPRILDYFTQGERSYLVMEFVNGKNLETLLDENKGFLPDEQVVQWAIELCDVLSYLHTHKPEPIIFRDMKPANIMLSKDDRLMLVDFGIAKQFEAGLRGTQVGTEGYCPPEQYRGEATPIADIYGLGATIHHLLTRQDPRLEAPFSFGDRPIRTANQSVSIELEAVINTSLHYNPEDRFKTPQEMKEALISVARRTGMLSQPALASIATTTSSIIDPGGMKPLWVFKCEDDIRGTPTYYKGMLFVGCYDNNLYAIKATNGDFEWKFPTRGGIPGKPLVANNHVYFGSEDQNLYAVSISSGKGAWNYRAGGPIRSSPRIAQGHIFFGADDGNMHVVNISSSKRAWRVESGAHVRSTPFIHNDRVYFGNEDGEFSCVDFSGKHKWRYRAKRAITSSPIVDDGAVYFTSVDWMFYALDAEAGWVLWRFRMSKPSISSPAIADGKAFFGSVDGFIYCVDVRTGREQWRYRTENQVNGSPVIYKDSLYCGSVDGHMYCLDYKSGRLRWKFSTEGPITGSPVLFDDVIYFGSTDNNVYALLA